MAIKGFSHLGDDNKVVSSELAGTLQLVATVQNINLKNTGQTTLYTVPATGAFLAYDVIFVPTVADTITIAPIVRIGLASAYNEWLVLTTLTGLNAVNQSMALSTSALLAVRKMFSANDVIRLDVQTGATATSLTVTAYVIGIQF